MTNLPKRFFGWAILLVLAATEISHAQDSTSTMTGEQFKTELTLFAGYV